MKGLNFLMYFCLCLSIASLIFGIVTKYTEGAIASGMLVVMFIILISYSRSDSAGSRREPYAV